MPQVFATPILPDTGNDPQSEEQAQTEQNTEFQPRRPAWYTSITGTIESMEEKDGSVEILIVSSEGGHDVFILNADTAIYNVQLATGTEIIGFFRSSGIMTLQYPARHTIEAVTAAPKETLTIKGDVFEASEELRALLSSDGELVIHIGEHTQIVDANGDLYKGGSIAGKPLLVFYHVVALSMPPQTTPDTIVVVEKAAPAATEPVTPVIDDRFAITMTIGSTVVGQGRMLLPPPPVAPQIINGRTMLPLRYVIETILQGDVSYDDETRTITATIGDQVVIMVIDNPEVNFIGVDVIDYGQAPVIADDFTLVPLRAFEMFFAELRWDSETSIVTIIP